MADRRPGRRGGPPESGISGTQPVVAIVGYPNVGKSTLFNRLTRSRDAVVDALPGVTRDRRQGAGEWVGRRFQLIDTGGIDAASADPISRQVTAQAAAAIGEADVVLFVIDARAGAGPGDLEVADRLRGFGRPVLVVANKCDGPVQEAAAQELWSLGLGPVLPISAQHGRGIGELLDAIVEALPAEGDEPDTGAGGPPAIAIMGRPNVGKSSILNVLLGEDRVVVHDRPGTTRDPVDTLLEVDGSPVVLTDTAGLRRRGRASGDVERYSQLRALRAAARSDVAMIVCDAVEGITDTDLAAADQVVRARCATMFVINKWDLAQPDLERLRERVTAKVRHRPPLEVCSAVSGEGVHRLIPAALRLAERRRVRLSTGALNRLLRELAAERPGPMSGGRRLSLRYLVQTGDSPPRLRLDVNDRSLMTRDYGFWLENRIRRHFDLDGVPIILQVEGRRSAPTARGGAAGQR
jgi:GTPase